MTIGKRLLDVGLCLVLIALFALPILVISALVLLREGRPVFYLAERMKAPGQPFRLWKFRTMTVVARDDGVSGGDKAARITPTGRFLRRTRLDELPQLWNVLKGDMSFVGPRPPLRTYVERFPDLYARVLRSRPGVTGLATLHFHAAEGRLLAHCRTAAETDEVYCRRCIPRKARLDLIYQRHANPCLDVILMLQTLGRLFFRRKPARKG